jgi:hypothetical protein
VDTTECNDTLTSTNVQDASGLSPGAPVGAGAMSVVDKCADGDDWDIRFQSRPVGMSTSPYDIGAYEKP